ncbi:hypothetical protein E5D57_003825 [Metarhizium anisopliae]|nr:hypothetical protein E5D57_003825 [Metarhizium anisopliae]
MCQYTEYGWVFCAEREVWYNQDAKFMRNEMNCTGEAVFGFTGQSEDDNERCRDMDSGDQRKRIDGLTTLPKVEA